MRLKKILWLLFGAVCAALLRHALPGLCSAGSEEKELLRSVGNLIARQEAVFVR